MICTILYRTKASAKQRHFLIEILLDDEDIVLRKSELIFGITVPIDETYVLNLTDAISLKTLWILKIYGISLN